VKSSFGQGKNFRDVESEGEELPGPGEDDRAGARIVRELGEAGCELVDHLLVERVHLAALERYVSNSVRDRRADEVHAHPPGLSG
jgi:hypothetical protein